MPDQTRYADLEALKIFKEEYDIKIDEKFDAIPDYVIRNIEDVTKIAEKTIMVGFYFYLNNPLPNGLYYYDRYKYGNKILYAVIVNAEGTAVDRQFNIETPYLLDISSDEENINICAHYAGGITFYSYDIANKTYTVENKGYNVKQIDKKFSDLNTSIAEQFAEKAELSHTHDDRYYTETEVDGLFSNINTSIDNIKSGSTPVQEATHSSTADTATNATNAGKADLATKAEQDGNGNVIVETYETKSDALAKLAEVIALKPDWNQNDETASDYVKNRPFYTENEGEITEIVPETTFTIDNEGMWYSEKFAIPIEAGNTYICKYNGVEYICTAFSYAQDGIEWIFLGNMGKTGADFEDTGEPFVIVTVPAENMTMVILHDGTVSTNITCSITMNNEIIHKLPNKYLDLDWKPTKEYKLTDVFPINNVTFTGKEITLIDSQVFYLHVGEEYTVNWNGTEYVCEAKRIDADPFSIFYIGNTELTTLTNKEDTGEPFIYVYYATHANTNAFYAKLIKSNSTAETITCSVKGYTDVYNKIPTNFLPDSYVIPTDIDAGLVINELRLADKAFQEGRRVYARKGGVFGQVIYLGFDSVDSIFNQMWFVSDSKMFYIWSYEYGSTNGVAKTNYIVVGLVPDISGTRGYSVPVPSEMKAGQMVRLKSIDESKASGYNMAWEAVDPWVIESSTAGSTKKFKLTVDDSGILSATEVTE